MRTSFAVQTRDLPAFSWMQVWADTFGAARSKLLPVIALSTAIRVERFIVIPFWRDFTG
jgi:hypothetical protein